MTDLNSLNILKNIFRLGNNNNNNKILYNAEKFQAT